MSKGAVVEAEHPDAAKHQDRWGEQLIWDCNHFHPYADQWQITI
jgi:hypothetical protein